MAKPNILGSQFETHVQNIMQSVRTASPSQTKRGEKWYPEAHNDVRDLAVAELPQHPMEDLDAPLPGGNLVGAHHVPPPGMQRAAGEVAALSPARPSGMRFENNIPAAHQLHSMTDEQRGSIDTAVSAYKTMNKTGGALKKAKNSGVGIDEAHAAHEVSRADFKAKSATARAPFKGTPMGHAGVLAIKKASDINTGKVDPLKALGVMKERHFAHDLLRPYDAEVVFHGASGTIDEHMRNVMEGKTERFGWNPKPGDVRTAPNPGKPAGYAYGRAALHEASRRLGMRPNAAQPISWINEKETKPRKGRAGTV